MRKKLVLGFSIFAACARPQRPAVVTVDPSELSDSYALSIRLHRPWRVGERRREVLVTDVHRVTRMTRRGALEGADEQRYHVSLDAIRRVLEVDAWGNALRDEYEVTMLTRTTPQGERLLLRDGARVTVTRARTRNAAQVAVTGSADVEAVHEAMLDAVEHIHHPGFPPPDEIYGTTEARRVDTSWPVEATLLSQGLFEATGLGTRLSGRARLAGRETLSGIACLRFEVNLHGAITSTGVVVPGFSLLQGEIRGRSETVLPNDFELHELEEHHELETHITLAATSVGVGAQVTVDEIQRRRMRRAPR